jgi:hypothetical protein
MDAIGSLFSRAHLIVLAGSVSAFFVTQHGVVNEK